MLSLLYYWQYDLRQRIAARIYCLFHRTGRAGAVRPGLINDPRKVLLVITGLIGDTVLCTPSIQEARRVWPGAKLTLLGLNRNCDLLAGCPSLDSLHESPLIPFSLFKRRRLAQLKAWLKAQSFDVGMILLGDQFGLLLAQAGIPVRVGVLGSPLARCLTHAYECATPRTWGPGDRLNALRVLGHRVQEISPKLWVTETARASAQRRLGSLGLEHDVPYAVLHPFGRTWRQHWPLDRADQLAEQLRREHGMKTLLIGLPRRAEKVLSFKSSWLVDARGAFSLQELVAVVEGASLIVSTDSGPFHIAGALHRPVVGLFRSSRPEFATLYPTSLVVLGQDPSCKERCHWNYCAAMPCRQMLSLDVPVVLDHSKRLLERGPEVKISQ